MARRVGIEPTRANRLLKTLDALGIVRQTADRRYEPGPGMHVLAAQAMFGSGLIPKAIDPLDELRRPGASIALGVLWRLDVSYLIHAGPGQTIARGIGRVGLFPAERSSIGTILLAQRDDRTVRDLLRTAPREIDAELLFTRLRRTRSHGFAAIEQTQDELSVAVPLPGQVDAAIAVAGAITARHVPSLVRDLRTAAKRISAEFSPCQSHES